jgi:hypothetical protein
MKVTWGAIITEGSGKLGGNVYARNHRGYYMKSKVSPLNPSSPRQVEVRQSLTACTAAWEALSESQRVKWNTSGSLQLKKDRFGDTIKLSGWNLFIKLNSCLVNAGHAMLLDCPETREVTQITYANAKVFLNNPGMFLFLRPGPPVGTTVKISASAQLSPGVNYCLRQLSFTYPLDIYAMYMAVFGSIVATGYKIFFEVSYINSANGAESIKQKFSVLIKFGAFRLAGVNWTNSGNFFGATFPRAILRLSNSEIILFGTGNNGKIIRSIDNAVSFNDLGQQFGQTYIYSFVECVNGDVIAGTGLSTGLFLRSIDKGLNWTNEGQFASEAAIMSMCKNSKGWIYAATRGIGLIARSKNNGSSWENLGHYSQSTILYSIVVNSKNQLFACSSVPGSIYSSYDDGDSWVECFTSTAGLSFLYLYVDEFDRIFACASTAAAGFLYVSNDNGLTWEVCFSSGSEHQFLYIFASNDGVYLICSSSHGIIFKSSDYALSFNASDPLFSQIRIISASDSVEGEFIAFGYSGGLLLRSNS